MFKRSGSQPTSLSLKGAIQLGITHTVGGLDYKPERDVLLHDFEVSENFRFPSAGSATTPAHQFGDFNFKTCAPNAFRYFRFIFGIRPQDYINSLCNDPLVDVSNPGSSGSLFYISSDDEFMMKTVQHKESEFLQKLLPGYFMNLNQNKRTLLPKFYGLYCVKAKGKVFRVVVMNNILPRSVQIHLRFDLKGSTHKRKASAKEKENTLPTYKDLDFMQYMPEGLFLDVGKYNAVCRTIQRDCLVLQSFNIMDYSLLLGIHNIDKASQEPQTKEGGTGETVQRRPQGQKSLYSTTIEAIQADTGKNESLDPDNETGGIPARNSKGEKLLVYIGIIDILQSYGIVKKLEHGWKALLHNKSKVSVNKPDFYAERFQKFMSNTIFRKIKNTACRKHRAASHGSFRKRVSSVSPLFDKFESSSSNQVSAKKIRGENEDTVSELIPRHSLSESSSETDWTDWKKSVSSSV